MFRRSDIQGLRAIAVVAVVLFHLNPVLLSGGFLGVDVFFVISGFVIGRLLLNELSQTGRIQLKTFFARRIFRLLPALAVVTITVVAFAHMFFTSRALHDTVNITATSTVTGTSNWIIAWLSGGYFGEAPEQNPLLHTWSLSAEWQFYLLIPLIFWGVQRLNSSNQVKRTILLSLLFALSVTSFLLNFAELPNLLEERVEVSGYYSPVGRFWQFFAGVIVAAYEEKALPNRRVSETLGVVGFALLLVSFVLFFGGMQTPGRSTLVPVLATVLLIVAGSHPAAFASRAMSSRPLTWLGDHSYSIYLWHWPILFFARRLGFLDTILEFLIVIVIVLVVSALSYRLVEVPMRYPLVSSAKGNALVALSLLLLPVLVVSGWSYGSDRYQSFLERKGIIESIAGEVGHDYFHQAIANRFSECSDKTIRDNALFWNSFLRCQQTPAVRDISVAVIGDSHAEHLFFGLAEASPGIGVAYYIQSELPVPESSQVMADIIERTANSQSIETVIVNAFWVVRGVPEDELRGVIEKFSKSGKTVILTNDIPSAANLDPSGCKVSPVVFGKRECQFEVYRFDRLAEINETLTRVASETDAILFDSYSLICPLNEQVCSMSVLSQDGSEKVIYRDGNHLNLEGSKLIGDELAKLIDRPK